MHVHAKEVLWSSCWIVSLLIELSSSRSSLCRFSVSPWSSGCMRLFRKLNFTNSTQTECTGWLLVSVPKAIPCSMNSNGTQNWNKRRSHTLKIMPVQLPERVWWTKSYSSFLNSSPFFYYRVIHFRYDMWRSTFQIGAALLRSVKEIAPKSSFLSVNRSPTRFDFRAGAKAIRWSVDRAGKSFGLTTSFLC